MSSAVYEFSGSSLSEFQTFSRVLRQEIYAGELGVRGATDGRSLTLQKGPSVPVPIYSVQSKITSTLRRTQKHVREDSAPFYLIWVLEKGYVGISASSETKLIREGSVIITDSRAPFFIEALIGSEGEHRCFVALVPPHLFHTSIHNDRKISAVHFSSAAPHGHVVADIISLLYHSGDALDERISTSLLRIALDALGQLLDDSDGERPFKRTIAEERLNQITSCIALHLGNPSFGLAKAAALCGISTRHISAILHKNGQSFSALLRAARAELADSLLRSPEMRHASIAEIAKISGFRGGADLSRTFSLHYGITPRQARNQKEAEPH